MRDTYARYVPLVRAAVARVTEAHEKEDVGTLAVLYKSAGELCMLAQEATTDHPSRIAPPPQ